MFGNFGPNLAPRGGGDSNPGPLGTKSRVLDHSAPRGHSPGELPPCGIIPLGNRPPEESSPWGIISLENRPPGESSPWGIVTLGNHAAGYHPPVKSSPWGIVGESCPWGITPLGNHPPGESSPWGITPLGNQPPGESPRGKGKNLEPRPLATSMPTIQKPWSGGASHSKWLWKWLSQIQVPSHSQAVGGDMTLASDPLME